MSRREQVVKILILGLLFIGIICPKTSLADAAKIFKENTEAVVVIIAYDSEGKAISQGSGFAVRQDGVIVTNFHVINRATQLEVKAINNGPSWDGHSKETEGQIADIMESLKVEGLIYIDMDNDIAIFKVRFNEFSELYPQYPRLVPPLKYPAPLKSLPSVKLGDINTVNVGEKIYVISSPVGFENTISEGILSGLRDFTMKEDLLPPIDYPQIRADESSEAMTSKFSRYNRKIEYRRKILQFSAPISPGSSGGPVFNGNGEVIGIATFLMKEGQNINFAMPVNLIKDEIENRKITPLAYFRVELGREYIRWLARRLVKIEVWTERFPPNTAMDEVCEEVLKLNPKHGQARFWLIIVHINRGEKKKALEHYRILKKVDPYWSTQVENLMGPKVEKYLSR